MIKRRDHTPITGKKVKSNSTGEKGESIKREPENMNERVSLIEKKRQMPSNNDSINSG